MLALLARAVAGLLLSDEALTLLPSFCSPILVADDLLRVLTLPEAGRELGAATVRPKATTLAEAGAVGVGPAVLEVGLILGVVVADLALTEEPRLDAVGAPVATLRLGLLVERALAEAARTLGLLPLLVVPGLAPLPSTAREAALVVAGR
jgi:hypothetical protein